MVMCSFCRQNYEPPRGITVVQKDATARYYCSGKCRKNAEMGRDNKKVNWVRKAESVKNEDAKRLEGKNERLEAKRELLEGKKEEKAVEKKAEVKKEEKKK